MLSVVREGVPSGILTEEARSGDLLVIGPEGGECPHRAGNRRLHHGGRRPLLTSARARSAPRRSARRSRVLFPYDGSPVAEGALQFCVNAFGNIWEEIVVLTVTEEMEESFPYDTELGYLGTHGIPYRLLMEAGKPVDTIPRVAKARSQRSHPRRLPRPAQDPRLSPRLHRLAPHPPQRAAGPRRLLSPVSPVQTPGEENRAADRMVTAAGRIPGRPRSPRPGGHARACPAISSSPRAAAPPRTTTTRSPSATGRRSPSPTSWHS